MRLLCFPYAGGESRIYRGWSDELAGCAEVIAVDLPGRAGSRDRQRFTAIEPLVDALFAELAPVLDRPYALFGHSMGALVAFELAHRAGRAGLPCQALLVSAHRAPDLPRTGEPLHALDDRGLIAGLARLNGTPAAVLDSPELIAHYLPTVRADLAVCETYEYAPRAPLACPIVAFGGLRDRIAPVAAVEAWRAHTAGSFELRVFPGDHFFLHSARDAVLHELARELERHRPRPEPDAAGAPGVAR